MSNFLYPYRVASGGESLEMTTRMVVAPVAGTFKPRASLARQSLATSGKVSEGQLLGYIVNATDRVEVTSPFTGEISSLIAWPNERVRKYQQVLSLEIAS